MNEASTVLAPELLGALLDETGEGLIVLDLAGALRYANTSARGLLGVPREIETGTPLAAYAPVLARILLEAERTSGLLPGDADFRFRARRSGDRIVVRFFGGDPVPLLRRASAHLELVQEAARMGTWEWDMATNVVTWSTEMERLFGIEPGAFSGNFEEFMDRVHPADRQRMGEAVEGLIASGTIDAEHRIILPSGDVRWLAARGRLLREPGESLRAIGVGIEITERKRTEEALRFIVEASRVLASSLDYEATLRRVARLAVPHIADWCAVHLLDEETGKVEQVSVAHVDPARVARIQELQRTMPSRAGDGERIRRVIESGEPDFVPLIPDAALAALDPERRAAIREIGFTSYMCVPMSSMGRTVGAITFATAESRRAYTPADLEVAQHLARRAAAAVENARIHREVERERARFASIILSINAGVHHVDRDGLIVFINPAAERLLGYSSAELAKKRSCAIVHAHNSDEPGLENGECPIIAPVLRGQSYRGETFFRRKDGTLLPVEVASAPIEVNGHIDGAVVIYYDVSERKEEQRVKDDFLAFASHELRSPLTPILGLARYLQRRAASEPQRFDEDAVEAITTLESETGRMGRVVELFLDLSRIESGRLSLTLDLADVAEIVRDEVAGLAKRFPEVTVEVAGAEHRLVAEIDGPRLRQVLSNLLENAAKYAGPGAIVSVRLAKTDGGMLTIEVEDDGPGIDLDELPHIFGRFYRGRSPAVQTKKGSGVGLYITRHLVEVAGGEITAASAPGAGARFTVTWPVGGDAEPMLDDA